MTPDITNPPFLRETNQTRAQNLWPPLVGASIADWGVEGK